ncbi:MAG: GDP-mannose 4,6-dehydratase [Gammaproteobacteria bacterium]|nr:GDP-mannose 4,6-dehydratase [Gammaproteobacteria bacterium]MDH3768546.1 GDP-mannose 4,6-dehydratase [Gammaproteobacteria bacterium]
MVKNWLITGGCGFIGLNLVRRLIKEPDVRVRVLDNLSVGTADDLRRVSEFRELPVAQSPFGDGVALMVGDILDDNVVEAASEGADVVVHLAANTGVGPSVEDPRADCRTNVTGTLNTLDAARHAGVTRFVFASSGAPVGECEPPIHEEMVPHPVSPYGASKLAGEAYCSAYFRTFGLETVALRFGNVYGPYSGKKSSVVAKFIRQVESGETLEIYGDGKQTRDFIFVEDIVDAIVLAVRCDDIGGEIFQIATNRESTILELIDQLLPIMRDAGFGDVKIEHGQQRPGDVRRNFSDTTKAREQLGWQSETLLATGLRRTVDWFVG